LSYELDGFKNTDAIYKLAHSVTLEIYVPVADSTPQEILIKFARTNMKTVKILPVMASSAAMA